MNDLNTWLWIRRILSFIGLLSDEYYPSLWHILFVFHFREDINLVCVEVIQGCVFFTFFAISNMPQFRYSFGVKCRMGRIEKVQIPSKVLLFFGCYFKFEWDELRLHENVYWGKGFKCVGWVVCVLWSIVLWKGIYKCVWKVWWAIVIIRKFKSTTLIEQLILYSVLGWCDWNEDRNLIFNVILIFNFFVKLDLKYFEFSFSFEEFDFGQLGRLQLVCCSILCS